MFVKIDTRPNFKILRPVTAQIHANMAGELSRLILENMDAPPHHLILEMDEVTGLEPAIITMLEEMQTIAKRKGYSFYMSGIAHLLKAKINHVPSFKRLNKAPTLAEAIDMIMMEKLERELM
ncbi:MAG: STAS domain-containing protein [Chitinophagaceae bacterium]|nr:MAG: STAS domain-containing protein [Chitinophagaceae bacterium]